MKKVGKVILGTKEAYVKPQNGTSAGDYKCWNGGQIVEMRIQ